MGKIVVTGASGFVGRHVLNLVPDAIPVMRSKAQCPDFISVPSLDDSVPWKILLGKNIDAIIHLAGLAHGSFFSDVDYHNVNVKGTLHLAEEAAKVGVSRFVFVSSIGVNGMSTTTRPFNVSSELIPHNEYSKSKYDAEIGLKKIAKETGLEVVIVRPTLVYGPDAPGNFGMLTKLIKRLGVLPFGLATNRRDFISVQNLADLLVTCATHPNAAGHTFLASDSETVSIKKFTNAIANGLGKKAIQLPVPVSLMRFAGRLTGKSAMIEQLYGNLEVDSSNIKEVLGWTPPFTMEQSMALLKHTDK
ncbi:TPA: NAD-dependent epimerase/dehydratase family protein [Vibrio vulnificus]|nr:NAD-dependent epimerase/dehydratase family protein [Vibrio vulnificus]HDY7675668.1 NAD-dependent epimerase/dehydratase family protein [Vibrio vulnificus]